MSARRTYLIVLFLLGTAFPYTAFSQAAPPPDPCPQLCLSAADPVQCLSACRNALGTVCGRPETQSCAQACDASWPGFCSAAFSAAGAQQACLETKASACTPTCIQSCPDLPEGFKDPAKVAAKMVEEVENARFKLTPAFDVETGVSMSATSRIAHAFDIGGTGSPWCSFAVFDGKGEFSSAEDATNHAEAALSSTMAYCRTRTGTSGTPVEVPFVFGLTADVRSKWGSFEEGEGDEQTTLKGNQLIAGAGLTMLFPTAPSWLDAFELTAAYYTVVDSGGNLTVPEELEVDHIQARLKSRLLPFPNNSNQILKDIALVVDGRASWPQGGAAVEDNVEYYTSLGLEIGSGKTAGTIRWERGKEVGFEYDRKLVVGVLLRFLGLGEN